MGSTRSSADADVQSTAAKLVSTARGRRGMSQRELARAANVPQSTVGMIESGRRQPSVAMLERLLDAAGFHLETRLVNTIRPSQLLERYRTDIAEAFARYPITRAWVFGSVARGDDRPDSDLDLLVELTSGASVVDIFSLIEDLSALLSCKVDIVTTTEMESNDLFRRSVDRHRHPFDFAA
ncbi:helix-turn-helix domain-containing protein [Frankia sp. CiP3]|uniref:helix-turn-helix domain-containing protein n=1 Tax=Frankia sp. CiP3 TaxID=2880971 RepID=UPI002101E135